ncbi:MAG: type VI secretion system ImpA family N-terminal domain-containing protein [Gammaproteobacteria bacterium]|nr:type VI secretion system ImpA family N-terminal domain-containing protein [Gammaproteobacteria bacterium]
MSATSVFQGLLLPLSEAAPCGQSLEDTATLSAFDAYKLFGQQSEIGTRRQGQSETDAPTLPDWNDMLEKSTAALSISKDLRVLAYFGAAQPWLGGLVPFCETLRVASGWLESWFDAVHPRIEEDIHFRTNALNNFNDRLAIVDALRRTPLLATRSTGPISLRHIELATGVIPVTKLDGTPTKEGEINAAFGAAPLAELRAQLDAAQSALAALAHIDATMLGAGGIEATPNFDGRSDKEKQVSLRHQLKRIHDILRTQIAAHPDAAPSEAAIPADVAPPPGLLGPIRTRQDAIRALDAVTTFFENTEPSSPVPLFIERAKRLIAKNFLDVLQDIVPDALGAAKAAGGIRDKK